MRLKTELQAVRMRLRSYDRQIKETRPHRFKTFAEYKTAMQALWARIAEDRQLEKTLKGKF